MLHAPSPAASLQHLLLLQMENPQTVNSSSLRYSLRQPQAQLLWCRAGTGAAASQITRLLHGLHSCLLSTTPAQTASNQAAVTLGQHNPLLTQQHTATAARTPPTSHPLTRPCSASTTQSLLAAWAAICPLAQLLCSVECTAQQGPATAGQSLLQTLLSKTPQARQCHSREAPLPRHSHSSSLLHSKISKQLLLQHTLNNHPPLLPLLALLVPSLPPQHNPNNNPHQLLLPLSLLVTSPPQIWPPIRCRHSSRSEQPCTKGFPCSYAVSCPWCR